MKMVKKERKNDRIFEFQHGYDEMILVKREDTNIRPGYISHQHLDDGLMSDVQVHHFTWAAGAPKCGAPPSPPSPQGAPMAAQIDGLSSTSWPASDHRQPNDGIQQIWAATHSCNGMHQRFRRWPRPATGGISMAPLEIEPSAASRKPIFFLRERPQPRSGCILTGIEQIKHNSNSRDAGSHESNRAAAGQAVSTVASVFNIMTQSKQQLEQNQVVRPSSSNGQRLQRTHQPHPTSATVQLQITHLAKQQSKIPKPHHPWPEPTSASIPTKRAANQDPSRTQHVSVTFFARTQQQSATTNSRVP
ncbi:hypothetical protein ACLOJK_039082 [Asimina triloba]